MKSTNEELRGKSQYEVQVTNTREKRKHSQPAARILFYVRTQYFSAATCGIFHFRGRLNGVNP